jgi:hypothetical protein
VRFGVYSNPEVLNKVRAIWPKTACAQDTEFQQFTDYLDQLIQRNIENSNQPEKNKDQSAAITKKFYNAVIARIDKDQELEQRRLFIFADIIYLSAGAAPDSQQESRINQMLKAIGLGIRELELRIIDIKAFNNFLKTQNDWDNKDFQQAVDTALSNLTNEVYSNHEDIKKNEANTPKKKSFILSNPVAMRELCEIIHAHGEYNESYDVINKILNAHDHCDGEAEEAMFALGKFSEISKNNLRINENPFARREAIINYVVQNASEDYSAKILAEELEKINSDRNEPTLKRDIEKYLNDYARNISDIANNLSIGIGRIGKNSYSPEKKISWSPILANPEKFLRAINQEIIPINTVQTAIMNFVDQNKDLLKCESAPKDLTKRLGYCDIGIFEKISKRLKDLKIRTFLSMIGNETLDNLIAKIKSWQNGVGL